MKRICSLLVFSTIFLAASVCAAANRVGIESGSPGVFYVKAYDLVDISGVEIELSYDTTALANPRITQGDLLSSTMFIPNPAYKPGMVKIAAMSLKPLQPSGVLAVLTFDLKGSAPGAVAVARRVLATSQGASVKPPPPSSGDPKDIIKESKDDTKDTSLNPPRGDLGSTNLAGVSMGTITLPQDQLATTEMKGEYQPLVTDLRKDMTIPVGGGEGGQVAAASASTPEGKQAAAASVVYKSVLQMFREFKGERVAASMMALFAKAAYPDFKQEPPIVISDGLNPVKVSLRLKPSGNESPKFILQGANVKQLRGEGEEYDWIVEAVPKKGVSEARLIAIDGQRTLEFPLVVAPPVNTALSGGAKTRESDFGKYLEKGSKYDLNKDEKIDYLDDYIFAANYIVAMKIDPAKLVEKVVKEPAKEEKKGVQQKADPAKPVSGKQSGEGAGEKKAGKAGEVSGQSDPEKVKKDKSRKDSDKQSEIEGGSQEKKKPEPADK